MGSSRNSSLLPARGDQMVGVVTTGGVEWPLQASTSYYPSSVDNAMIEKANYDRVSALSQAFAFWVARH